MFQLLNGDLFLFVVCLQQPKTLVYYRIRRLIGKRERKKVNELKKKDREKERKREKMKRKKRAKPFPASHGVIK